MKTSRIIAMSTITLALAACETTPTNSVESTQTGTPLLTELGKPSAPLAAMQAPAMEKVGDNHIFYRQGTELDIEVLASDNDTITKRLSNGCEFTDPVLSNNLIDMAPSVEWKNCRGSDGYARVTVNGELFPVEMGKTVSYAISGTVTKGSWTGNWSDRRKCKVSDQVRIQTLSGEYDTWKVVCKDKKNTRTFYLSPEIGRVVALKRKHADDRSRTYTSVYLREG